MYEFVLAAHHADFTARHELLHGSGPGPWRHIQLQQKQALISRPDGLRFAHVTSARPARIRQVDGPSSIGADIHMGIRAQPGQLCQGIKQTTHPLAIPSEALSGQVNRIFYC